MLKPLNYFKDQLNHFQDVKDQTGTTIAAAMGINAIFETHNTKFQIYETVLSIPKQAREKRDTDDGSFVD